MFSFRQAKPVVLTKCCLWNSFHVSSFWYVVAKSSIFNIVTLSNKLISDLRLVYHLILQHPIQLRNFFAPLPFTQQILITTSQRCIFRDVMYCRGDEEWWNCAAWPASLSYRFETDQLTRKTEIALEDSGVFSTGEMPTKKQRAS